MSERDQNGRSYEIAAPNASAMIESLRAFGYDLKTALSDLIDNSISAKASQIWIDAIWEGEKSTICVTDNGEGMASEELLEAMRPGSGDPREVRDPEDLGRFGLGLKTASFSQCRRLTVRSKTDEAPYSQFCWDLDYVSKTHEWRVLSDIEMLSEKCFSRLDSLNAGTVVLWQNMDRLVGGAYTDDCLAQNTFLLRLEDVKNHIAMVFHRFLRGRNALSIYINERPVEAWDPFLETHAATQRHPQEILEIDGQRIQITPFVLPHHSKLTSEEHAAAAGPRGWNSHQGFYVYRNHRLIVSGDWLGLGFQKEEHFKLARIQVDIPNSLDEQWAIDVRKARAHPPTSIRSDVKRIARLTRQSAANIYRHRGKVIARQSSDIDMFLWLHKVKHGKQFYSINRKHPLVEKLLNISDQNGAANALLRLIEETVPVPLIVINQAENPDRQAIPFEGAPAEEILRVMEQLLDALQRGGKSPNDALDRIGFMEPFDRYPELVTVLRERIGGANE